MSNQVAVVLTVRDDKIASAHIYANPQAFMQQLKLNSQAQAQAQPLSRAQQAD